MNLHNSTDDAHRRTRWYSMRIAVRKWLFVFIVVVYSVICYKSYTTERYAISSLNFFQRHSSPPKLNWDSIRYSKAEKTPDSLPSFFMDSQISRATSPTEGVGLSSYNAFDLDENHLNAGLQITSPRKSTYRVVELQNEYVICDTLHVFIEARGARNQPKHFGGDYFRARIYNEKFNASSSNNGPITDHGNGTYSAYFTLPWIGVVDIEVSLILPSEVISILRRVYQEHPYRMVYEGKFQSGEKTEITKCHVHMNTSVQLCNFTDEVSRQPWFCEKPKHLPCSSWIEHRGNSPLTDSMSNGLLMDRESVAFQTKNIRRVLLRSRPLTIEVQSNDHMKGSHLCEAILADCKPTPTSSHIQNDGRNTPMVAGFYYRDVWHSNICNAKYIGVSATLSCLQNKRLYFYGDSTLRQWHNYLVTKLPTLDDVTFYAHKSTHKVGPLIATDRKNNFTSMFFHHGLPIRNSWMLTKNIKYECNEINKLNADENTVVFLNLWAHFTSITLDDYRSRLICVRNALTRLYQRSPRTLVIMKSANTRSFAYTPTSTINFNDWYVQKLDSVMHEVLKDVPNIVIIDVWDMTNCHRTGSDVHPNELVVREEIKMMMSYVC